MMDYVMNPAALTPRLKIFVKSDIIIMKNNNKGGVKMSDILEVIMIVSFGASWPLNVIKSYKARTTKGKSLGFLCLIFLGYVAGISSKILNESYMTSFSSKWYVLFFYVLNLLMVGADLCIYFRNDKLDKKKEQKS